MTCPWSGRLALAVTLSSALSVVSPAKAAPNLSFSVSPTEISAGGSARLSWTAPRNADCVASGGWTGEKPRRGRDVSTGPLSATTSFTLTCSNRSGSTAKTVTVTVRGDAVAQPSLTFTGSPGSISAGAAATLTWTSTNTTACNASGAWTGAKSTSGSQGVTPAATSTYTLECTGQGGSTSKSVTVGVTAAPPPPPPPQQPTVSLVGDPVRVAAGGKSTLRWSATNATSCTASGGWSGSKALTGTESTAALAATTTFALACSGPGGTAQASTQVSVGAFAPLAVLANIPDRTAVDLGIASCTDVPGESANYCRISTDYSGMTYDPVNHMMLHFGGGHASTMTDAVHAIDLKVGTAWKDLDAPTPCAEMTAANLDTANAAWRNGRPVSAHTYGLVQFAPEQNELVLLGRRYTQGAQCGRNISNDLAGPVAHYSLATRAWSFSADTTSTALSASLPASAYDPVGKKMVILGAGGLALYDPATRRAGAPIRQLTSTNGAGFDAGSRFTYSAHMVYFPPTDRFYYFATSGQTYELTLDRANPAASTIDEIAVFGTRPPSGEWGYAFDSKNGVIGGAVANGVFHIFAPQTRTWTAITIPGGSTGSMAFHMIAYDPVNNVFIFRTLYEAGQRSWAFRFRN